MFCLSKLNYLINYRYVIIGIFFIRSLSLEGALEGIFYLLKVDVSFFKLSTTFLALKLIDKL